MDRIDAMKVFVTAVDEGSLAGAARRLKRSPTAVSRALTFLEARLGIELLHRTTRTLKLSEAGERYAAACRRVLTELNEADMLASGERSSPRGVLTISAPPVNGEEMLRPITDEFLERYPDVSVTILLLDRLVNIVDAVRNRVFRFGRPALIAELKASGRNLCVPALLSLLTGIRRNEVLALRWGRVDLGRNNIGAGVA